MILDLFGKAQIGMFANVLSLLRLSRRDSDPTLFSPELSFKVAYGDPGSVITGIGAFLAIALPLFAIWLLELGGVASLDEVLDVLARIDFLVGATVVGTLAYVMADRLQPPRTHPVDEDELPGDVRERASEIYSNLREKAPT